MTPATIQWYPGHIARAERLLRGQLKKVDLVLEIRDARIPQASRHPQLERWVGDKPRLLVMNRRDMVPRAAQSTWDQWLRLQGAQPLWCNSRNGDGTRQVLQAAVAAGDDLNQRRRLRDMQPRPVRALVLGFPNVGKSALINRLVGRRVVASARRAGVTRTLQWVRLGTGVDLLDAPGVLPPRLDNRNVAELLAMCDDIGEGAYDSEAIARVMLQLLWPLVPPQASQPLVVLLRARYGIETDKSSSFDSHHWLEAAAMRHTSGATKPMAQRLLNDFRKGHLGSVALEMPPLPPGTDRESPFTPARRQ